jgi:transposase
MSMSCADAGTEPVRRFEVFTGAGVRRVWSAEDKAAIVAESYAGFESVRAVARRHGLSHSQHFTWRRQMRGAAETTGAVPASTTFVPAVIEPASLPVAANALPARKRRRGRSPRAAAVELEMTA